MKPLVALLCLVLSIADVTQKPENILVIGDSQVGSVYFVTKSSQKPGETTGQTMARLAGAQHAGETIVFEYKGGTGTNYWSKDGHAKESLDRHPEAGTVFIFLGTNDYFRPNAPDPEPILKEIRARGMRCVWAGNTAVNGQKWTVNEKLKAAVEKDCVYVDSQSIPLGDKVHPTGAGVIEWIKLMWKAKAK